MNEEALQITFQTHPDVMEAINGKPKLEIVFHVSTSDECPECNQFIHPVLTVGVVRDSETKEIIGYCECSGEMVKELLIRK